jgi:voltage-gated potassium channel
MLVLALAILPLLLIPLVAELSPATETALFVTDWVIWSAFALEYLFRLYLARDRRRFFRRNLLDLALVVLPFLRPLRVVRSARGLRMLRAARGITYMARAARTAKTMLVWQRLGFALVVGLLAVGIGGMVVFGLERDHPHANIESIPDALWWAVVTVTTVGYGDAFPMTPAGRVVAVVLMLLGIGLFGILAASLASYFLATEEGPNLSEVVERLERIERLLGQVPAAAERSDDEAQGRTPHQDVMGHDPPDPSNGYPSRG